MERPQPIIELVTLVKSGFYHFPRCECRGKTDTGGLHVDLRCGKLTERLYAAADSARDQFVEHLTRL